MVRCWSATSRRSLWISAISSVVGPAAKPRSFLAWLTQFPRVSVDPIPRSRATSLIRRPRSSTSSTARRRSSSEYFRGLPIAAVSSLQARRPRNRHCIKPGLTRHASVTRL